MTATQARLHRENAARFLAHLDSGAVLRVKIEPNEALRRDMGEQTWRSWREQKVRETATYYPGAYRTAWLDDWTAELTPVDLDKSIAAAQAILGTPA